MEPIGSPIFAPAVGELLGFDQDGRLVTMTSYAEGDREIAVWDLERRAEVGRIRLMSGVNNVVDGGLLSTQAGSARLPTEVPLQPREWWAGLCRLIPGEPSAGAVALLPAGAERSSPCG
jgi:hypothetical protein